MGALPVLWMGSFAASAAAPRECRVQRFFSTFPDRWPGVGLLLLRGVVGVTAVIQGGTCLANAQSPSVALRAAACLAILSGAALLVGFLTPGATVAAGLAIGVIASWGTALVAGPFLDDAGAWSVVDRRRRTRASWSWRPVARRAPLRHAARSSFRTTAARLHVDRCSTCASARSRADLDTNLKRVAIDHSIA